MRAWESRRLALGKALSELDYEIKARTRNVNLWRYSFDSLDGYGQGTGSAISTACLAA